jgi:hypothetical protein
MKIVVFLLLCLQITSCSSDGTSNTSQILFLIDRNSQDLSVDSIIKLRTSILEDNHEFYLKQHVESSLPFESSVNQRKLENPDIIIFYSNNLTPSDWLNKTIQEYSSEKIPVVAYHHIPRGLTRLNYFIGYDYAEIGRSQANYLINEHPEGIYTLIVYDSLSVLEEIQIEAINSRLSSLINSGRVNLLKSLELPRMIRQFDPGFFYKKFQDQYFNKGLSSIIALDDRLALSTADVYNDPIWQPAASIAGFGGEIPILLAIQSDRVKLSLLKDEEILSDQLVMAIDALLRGETGYFQNRISYENRFIASQLLVPFLIDTHNFEAIIYGMEYFTEKDLESYL